MGPGPRVVVEFGWGWGWIRQLAFDLFTVYVVDVLAVNSSSRSRTCTSTRQCSMHTRLPSTISGLSGCRPIQRLGHNYKLRPIQRLGHNYKLRPIQRLGHNYRVAAALFSG